MLTVEEFLARSGAGQSTLAGYRDELLRFERALGRYHKDGKSVPLAQASKRDLYRIKEGLRAQRGGPQRAVLLRMFYRAAGRPDLVELMRLKQRTRRLAPDEILTLPEVNALIAACTSLRDRALIAMLWETGGRVHEVAALDVGHVKEFHSRENGGKVFLTVFFHKVKVPGEEHSSLLIEAAEHVKAWLRAYPGVRPDLPLFPSPMGGRLSRDGIEQLVARTATRAGITKHVHPHLFRHSRITHLLRIGVPEAQVKKLVGLKPNSAMLARYSHLADRDAYAALLRAHGMEPPEPIGAGGLIQTEGELRPVVPMAPRPGGALALGPPADAAASFEAYITTPEGKAWWGEQQARLIQSLKEALRPRVTSGKLPVSGPVAPAQAPQAGDLGRGAAWAA